jgi:serine/threonine protein kinase
MFGDTANVCMHAGSSDECEHIDWPTRFKIAIQTAQGLQYLHNEFQPQIIHGDIKASNVLLNSNLDAKISDFGLVKLCPDDNTNFTTNLAGTM